MDQKKTDENNYDQNHLEIENKVNKKKTVVQCLPKMEEEDEPDNANLNITSNLQDTIIIINNDDGTQDDLKLSNDNKNDDNMNDSVTDFQIIEMSSTESLTDDNLSFTDNEGIVTPLPEDDDEYFEPIYDHFANSDSELNDVSVLGSEQSLNQSNELSLCRICHSDENESLISPCSCSGSIGFVHQSCLEKWLNRSGKRHCEICHYRFDIMEKIRYSFFAALKAWFQVPENRQYIRVDTMITVGVSALTVLLVYFCIRAIKEENKTDFTPYRTGFICVLYSVIMINISMYFYCMSKVVSLEMEPFFRWWINDKCFVLKSVEYDYNSSYIANIGKRDRTSSNDNDNYNYNNNNNHNDDDNNNNN